MANFNLNKVILSGRLTATPELKQTPQGVMVAQFTVAINRRGGKDEAAPVADFIKCSAWRELAEFVTKFFRKGSSICVVGRIQTRTWTDKQGNKQYATDVVADEVHFVDSKSEGAAENVPMPVPTPNGMPPQTPQFETFSGGDDLPF